LPELGEKGAGMGKNNASNGLAHKLNVSYAGGNVKKSEDCFENTSPIISFGLGRFTHVPWIVFTNYSQQLMNGIYPVLLFYTEQKKIVLSYGISETNTPKDQWSKAFVGSLRTVSETIPEADKYCSSFIYKIYDIDHSYDKKNMDALIIDLEKVIKDFHSNFLHKTHRPQKAKVMTSVLKIEKYKLQFEQTKNGTLNYDGDSKVSEKLNSKLTAPAASNTIFPDALLNWSANKSSAVRVSGQEQTGRPMGRTIENKLIMALNHWIADLENQTISNILLLGGPGNGKTDTLDWIIQKLISHCGLSKTSIDNEIGKSTSKAIRRCEIDTSKNKRFKFDKIVTVAEATSGDNGKSAAECLFEDFNSFIDDDKVLYISCINRGVLEDLKFFCDKKGHDKALALVELIGSSTLNVGKESWPLEDHGGVGVWFMDYESLFDKIENTNESPAQEIQNYIWKNKHWDWYDSFPLFKKYCPYYLNYQDFENNPSLFNGLLENMELMSASRINFRNYFSLASSIFANSPNAKTPIEFSIENVKSLLESNPDMKGYITALSKLLFVTAKFRLFRNLQNIFDKIRGIKSINGLSLFNNLIQSLNQEEFTELYNSKQTPFEEKYIISLNEYLNPNKCEDESLQTLVQEFSLSIKDGYNKLFQKTQLDTLEDRFFNYLILIEDEMNLFLEGPNTDSPKKYSNAIKLLKSFAGQLAANIYCYNHTVHKDHELLLQFKSIVDSEKDHKKLKKELKSTFVTSAIYPLHSFRQPKGKEKNSVVITSHNYLNIKLNIKNTDLKRASKKGVFMTIKSNDSVSIPITFQLLKALKLIGKGINKNSMNSEIISLIDRIEQNLYSAALHPDEYKYNEIKLNVLGEDEIEMENIEGLY